MATATDYDTLRAATTTDDSLEESQARRRAPATMFDTDDVDLATS